MTRAFVKYNELTAPPLGPFEGLQQEWFHTFEFFIPKSISEPWLGDIREVRAKMVLEGYSRRMIGWATFTQFLVLVVYWFLSKVFELLTPFKTRA